MASFATTRVLETYELLEMVLAKTTPKDLFVMQRVSKTWKSLIERSEQLQQTMFLKPAGKAILPAKYPDDPPDRYSASPPHDQPEYSGVKMKLCPAFAV